MSTQRLSGKIAFVTGAANGIGAGICKRFEQEGATVVGADIAFDGDRAILQTTDRDTMYTMALDVGDEAEVNAAISAVVSKFGGLDVCVCNAALIHAADFLDIDLADYERVLRVNMTGVFLTSQAAAKAMVAGGRKGSIINMSSVNAILAHSNQIPYVISKGGVNQLTKASALSLATKGVRVNAIGPGSIATEMLNTIMTDEAARAKIMSRTPMGRLGEVDEIAKTAVFLASDDSSYITGQTIYVDGGRLPLGYTV